MLKRSATVNCVYGDTSSTKTSRLGDAAEYYYELLGKPSRLICTDNAGWGPLDSLVDAGVIVPFKVNINRPHLIGDLSKMTQGWWPADPQDPMSPLVAPDKNGLNKGEVAAIMLDGITNACSMMMEVHQKSVAMVGGNMTAGDIKVPEMPRDSYIKSGDDYLRRFTGRSDYMGVQDRAVEFIRNLSMLPVPSEVTALEAKGEDEQKKPIYGPQFIGKALTGVCGPWFANLVHLDFLSKVVEIEDPVNQGKRIQVEQPQPVMFLKPHYDPSDPLKIKYPAKVRAPRTLYHKVPAACAPDLKQLYEFLDSLREEERASRKKVESPAPVGASK